MLKELAFECSLGDMKHTYWSGNPLGKGFDKSSKELKN